MILRDGKSWSGNERHCCFLNTGQQQFADVSAVSGFDFPDDGRAIASVDWDNDGDLDVWVSNRNAPRLRFLRNDTPGDNHFLRIQLVGNGTTTSRDAIGARVEVATSDARPLIKTLRAGEGFLAQSSKWLHFGLGAAGEVEKVVVHWPGGDEETFAAVEVGKHYQLVQGEGIPRVVKVKTDRLNLTSSVPQVPPTTDRARLPLVTLLPVPKLTYDNWDGTQRAVQVGSGKAVLVNLWASWCAPCVKELATFAEHEAELKADDVEVVALSVERLDRDQTAPDNARQVIEQIGLTCASGYATPAMLETLQGMHDLVLKTRRPLPVPTSFLIDREGRLAVIYKGPLEVNDLLADVDHSSADRMDRFVNAAMLPGRVIRHDRLLHTLEIADLNTHVLFANGLNQTGRYEDAELQYTDILNSDPNIAEVYYNRGVVRNELGRPEQALDDYSRAIELKPEYTDAYTNRGAVYQKLGKLELAFSDYDRAIEIDPELAEAYSNRGMLHHIAGKYELALADYARAIDLKPDLVDAYFFRAMAYRDSGQYDHAIRDFARTIVFQPDRVDAYLGRGAVCAALGETESAINDYTAAIKLQPNLANAYKSRAAEYLKLDDFGSAVRDYTRITELDPNDAVAFNNLAWILAACPESTHRNGGKAVLAATRACELTGWKHWNALGGLAAAYAEQGRFAEAIKWQTEALNQAPSSAKPLMQSRRESYEAGKPYRVKSATADREDPAE